MRQYAVCFSAFSSVLVVHPSIADVIIILHEVKDLAEITTRNNKTVCSLRTVQWSYFYTNVP
jgi:hypothetical protein